MPKRYIDIYDAERGSTVGKESLKRVDVSENDIILQEQNSNVIHRDKDGKVIGDKNTIWAALAHLGIEIIQVYKKDPNSVKDTGLGVYIRCKEGVFLDYDKINKLGIQTRIKP